MAVSDGARLLRKYRKRRCPRSGCKGRIGELRERMIGWEYFSVDARGVLTALGPDGDHHAPVVATCSDCGHEWTLRRIHQLPDVLEQDREAGP